MEQTSVHPDEVLRALLDKGPRSQKAAHLKALHSICASQYAIKNQAMRDFSLPTIGRVCEVNGILKGRVLYNAASKDYVELIKAWASYSGTPDIKLPKKISNHRQGTLTFCGLMTQRSEASCNR